MDWTGLGSPPGVIGECIWPFGTQGPQVHVAWGILGIYKTRVPAKKSGSDNRYLSVVINI
jgi:hypothetical protein